jgi:hypothetical protein
VIRYMPGAAMRTAVDSAPMVYVASSPEQPTYAWAAVVDRAESATQTARCLRKWTSMGGVITRVDAHTAAEMLLRFAQRQTDTQSELENATNRIALFEAAARCSAVPPLVQATSIHRGVAS